MSNKEFSNTKPIFLLNIIALMSFLLNYNYF